MEAQERRRATVENIERGARPWIDFEQKGGFVLNQKIRGGETLDPE
jgi:hypothetical protein